MLSRRDSTTTPVATIYWYADPGCPVNGQQEMYAVPPFANQGYDPDSCDQGGASQLPWSATDGTLQTGDLPFKVQSFQVAPTFYTCNASGNGQNQRLGGVSLLANCRPQYDDTDYNYYCENCASEGWSSDTQDYDTCINTPNFYSATSVSAYAIDRFVTDC